MKKVFNLSVMMVIMMTLCINFSSCSSDKDDGNGSLDSKIQVNNAESLTQTVYADETTGASSVTFTTTGAWNADIPAEAAAWLSINQKSGDKAGEYSIVITLATNTTGADRTGVIVILCDGKEIMITITQTALTADGKTPVAVTDINLNVTALTLTIGKEQTLTATVLPANATNPTVTWTSDNTAVATVSANGKVTAVAKGAAKITAKAGNQTATCSVTVNAIDPALTYDAGVVINGVKWATRNIAAPGTFAAKLEDYGMFYKWNSNVAWNNSDPIMSSNGDTTWDGSTPPGDFWEKSNDPSPAGWRVPTYEEQQKLVDKDKVTSEWTNINGVNGRKFTDKISGNSIFLPAAGTRYSNIGVLSEIGIQGCYRNGNNDSCLRFDSNGTSWFGTKRSGMSIRAVAE